MDSATAVASNPGAAAPALGSLLAERYEIAVSLAQGGIGAVCRARDRVLAEDVAIRLARAERPVDEETADRLRSQGALASRIAHPSVGRVHEYGWVGAVCFVSMELLEGRSLRDELESRPSGYPPGEALDLCLQVARGLQAIHEAGVIHRDVKPACAVRDVSGAVRVTGFGIPLPPVRDPQVGTAVVGPRSATPEYMSPEECLGRAADQRSEIYALGILCYELFTGQPPFWGESLAATLLQQLEDPPPFETQQGRRVPPRIRPVLARALAKSPGDRYGTVRDLADALRRAGPGDATRDEAEVGSTGPNAAAAVPPPGGTGSDLPDRDRRRESRLKVPLDLRIRKLDPNGGVVGEERTVAEDVSRGGARILTSIGPFSLGDRVEIEQVGGAFACLAEVRNRVVGPDGICRLGVSFIDCHAPPELVGDLAAPVPVGSAASASRSSRQPAPEPAVGSPATAERALRILAAFEKLSEKDHFEVLGVPRTVSDAELKRAYAARAREYHPDTARDPMIGALSRELNALFIRAGEAYEALRNPVRRRDYAARLPPAVEPFPVAVPATPLGSAPSRKFPPVSAARKLVSS
jgi:serine/threonine protein kinase